MTGNEQDAEEVVQETFLRAYRRLEGFKFDSAFSTWLQRIAANCSVRSAGAAQSSTRKDECSHERKTNSLELPSGSAEPERLILSGEVGRKVAEVVGCVCHRLSERHL